MVRPRVVTQSRRFNDLQEIAGHKAPLNHNDNSGAFPQARKPFIVRAKFAKFRDAIAAQRAVDAIPITRTRFRRWLDRHSASMSPEILYAAGALLLLMDNEATTRNRAEHSFQEEQLDRQRSAFKRLLLSNVNQQSTAGSK